MNIELGQRLKHFGDRKFKTKKEFADALGMQTPSLYKYLNGEREPGTQILIKLLDLGCDINWLLTGTEDVLEKDFKYQDSEIKRLNMKVADLENRLYQVRVTAGEVESDVQKGSKIISRDMKKKT